MKNDFCQNLTNLAYSTKARIKPVTQIGRGGFRMSKVAIVTGAGQGIGFA